MTSGVEEISLSNSRDLIMVV